MVLGLDSRCTSSKGAPRETADRDAGLSVVTGRPGVVRPPLAAIGVADETPTAPIVALVVEIELLVTLPPNGLP